MYLDVKLFIDGKWCAAEGGNTIDVFNPATNEAIGKVASASRADLDRALAQPTAASRYGARFRLSNAARCCAAPPI